LPALRSREADGRVTGWKRTEHCVAASLPSIGHPGAPQFDGDAALGALPSGHAATIPPGLQRGQYSPHATC